MRQHLERMLNEQVELCEKILKLGEFITQNPIFSTLSKDEKYDMKLQFDAMTIYRDILQHRIDREMAQLQPANHGDRAPRLYKCCECGNG